MIRVLIADDHEMVREGLYFLLSESEDIEVVGQARDGDDAVALAESLRPDVLLLDLQMPRRDGLAVTEAVKQAGTAQSILILTSFAEEEKIRAVLRAGATGFLLKDMLRHQLVQAIRDAAAGVPTLHPVAQQLLMRGLQSPETPETALTEREQSILIAIGEGKSNKEIAATLGLTLGTVKGYVSAVLSKLQLADRTQAALYAHRNGWTRPPT